MTQTTKEQRLRAAARAFMKVMRDELSTATTPDDIGALGECFDRVQEALGKWNDDLWERDEAIDNGTLNVDEPYC